MHMIKSLLKVKFIIFFNYYNPNIQQHLQTYHGLINDTDDSLESDLKKLDQSKSKFETVRRAYEVQQQKLTKEKPLKILNLSTIFTADSGLPM